MNKILYHLQEKNVYQVSQEEAVEILEKYSTEKEFETGIAGPIKILTTDDQDKKLVLETNQKGANFIRFVEKEYVQDFVKERLSIYDKMWDGCGCKVFYDEVWEHVIKEKNIEM